MLESPPRPLKVATYNIHSCLGTDRRFSPERLLRALAEIDADIIGLQEVGWHWRGQPGFDQYDFLTRETDYQVLEGVVRNHQNAHFGNALLTRVPATAVRSIDLSVPYRVTRGALDVDLQISGRNLRVINAHFGLDPLERRIQFERIVASLQDKTHVPTILMGDFNEWRLNFAAIEAFNRLLPNRVAPRSFHTRRPLFRFDRIYAGAGIALSDGQVHSSALTKQASDHLPVSALAMCRT